MEDILVKVKSSICGGVPVIKGTRIPVVFLLSLYKAGTIPGELAKDFDLDSDTIQKLIKQFQRNNYVIMMRYDVESLEIEEFKGII